MAIMAPRGPLTSGPLAGSLHVLLNTITILLHLLADNFQASVFLLTISPEANHKTLTPFLSACVFWSLTLPHHPLLLFQKSGGCLNSTTAQLLIEAAIFTETIKNVWNNEASCLSISSSCLLS
jgi:hypothetical protein